MKSRGDSPEKAAEYLLAKIPQQFIEYLELPNWLDLLSEFLRMNLSEHGEWLALVRDAVIRGASPKTTNSA